MCVNTYICVRKIYAFLRNTLIPKAKYNSNNNIYSCCLLHALIWIILSNYFNFINNLLKYDISQMCICYIRLNIIIILSIIFLYLRIVYPQVFPSN